MLYGFFLQLKTDNIPITWVKLFCLKTEIRFYENQINLFFLVKHRDGASGPAAADERKYERALLCRRADNGSCVSVASPP